VPPVSKASRPRLEPTTRSFLASAEAVFRARRNDPQFDFSGPAIEYAKAVETELNALIFPALRRVLKSRQPNQREVRGPEGRMDLGGRVPHQSLGSVKVLLEREGIVQKVLRQTLNATDAGWLLGELPHRARVCWGSDTRGCLCGSLGPRCGLRPADVVWQPAMQARLAAAMRG
jgi:hypothetical protein